jgi:hypothetical protein
MTAQVFREQVMKLLLELGATGIEIEDGEADGLIFAACIHKGEKYELSMQAPDAERKERARGLVLDAVRRFANGK